MWTCENYQHIMGNPGIQMKNPSLCRRKYFDSKLCSNGDYTGREQTLPKALG